MYNLKKEEILQWIDNALKGYTNEVLQWIGALLIIAGHLFNSLGSSVHNDVWNVVSFGLGTVFFFVWSLRVHNRPQIAVNVVAIIVCAAGLYRAVV